MDAISFHISNAPSEPIDLVFWGNILAGLGLMLYTIFLLLQAKGYFNPSVRITKFIRYFCFILLLMPVAARFYYPHQMILFLSATLLLVGLIIKLKRMLGL